MAFRKYNGNDNWKWQLRGNDGRWIDMFGPVIFDYTPKGGGPAKKGHGTFQGMISPGRASIFVKDDPELEVGLYEVQSKYITGVKAIIPSKPKDKQPVAALPKVMPEAEESPDEAQAPKRRRVDSQDMKREFGTTKTASELKDEITRELLKRILDKGVTKDDLVNSLFYHKKLKESLGVSTLKAVDLNWDVYTGMPKWEGSKKLSEIEVAVLKTTDYGKDSDGVRHNPEYGTLGKALNGMSRLSDIVFDQELDYENTSLTYDEAVELIRKANNESDEKYKSGIKHFKHAIAFENNIDEIKDMIAYSSVSEMVSSWAGSSNDESIFSLALQDTVEKIFNIEKASPWYVRPEVLGKKEDFIKKHEKVIKAYAEAQYEATQENLKAKGIASVELHRGMHAPDVRTALDEYRGVDEDTSLDDYLVILRPISSFSYDIRTAAGFAGDDPDNIVLTYQQWKSNPNAIADIFGDYDEKLNKTVLKPNEYMDIYGNVHQFGAVVLTTTVPAEKIFSMPFSGVGCLSESEVVVLGPNLRAEVMLPVAAEDLANKYDLEEKEEEEDN